MVQVGGIDEIHAVDLINFFNMPMYHKKRNYTYVLVNVEMLS